jgi:hypothetical protein
MNGSNILSKDHFAAHEQVVSDYKLLLRCENEITRYSGEEKNLARTRLTKEMILILERIIINKNILIENTQADQDYLKKLMTFL